MRTISLARVAAQAEILLLRRLLAVAIRHAVFGVVAAVFGLAVLVLLHVATVLALERFAGLSQLLAVAIVLGVDLVIAAIFGLMAAGKITDPVAEEARRVRDTSLEQARQSLTLAALLAPATRMLAQTGLIRVIAQAVTSGLRRSRG